MYILLIDDKQAILDIVTPLLINSGHTVETASNGLDAYEKAQQKTFAGLNRLQNPAETFFVECLKIV